MKNIEKYRCEILDFSNDHGNFCDIFIIPKILKKYNLDCTDINCGRCRFIQGMWMNEEYEEPKIDWSKVPVDTLIEVRDEGTEWIKRYCEKYKSGYVYAFIDGTTSKTANGVSTPWEFARLVEE